MLHPTLRTSFAGLTLLLLLVAAALAAGVVHSVGSVTWHPKAYIGKTVDLRGYVLAIDGILVLFSDEATGAVSAHDLPVAGPGADLLVLRKHYLLTGVFIKDASPAANGSPYHLQLTAPPTAIGP